MNNPLAARPNPAAAAKTTGITKPPGIPAKLTASGEETKEEEESKAENGKESVISEGSKDFGEE